MGRKTASPPVAPHRAGSSAPCLLVVLLVKAAHQFLEDPAHAVVVETGMLDQAVGVVHRAGLRLMSGEVSFSISVPRASARDRRGIWLRHPKLSRMSWTLGENPSRYAWKSAVSSWRLARARKCKPGDVVERLPGRLAQGGVLLDDAGVVEGRLHIEDCLLAALQHRVEATQHGHRQDHVAILAAHIEVAQNIVADAPDVVRDPVQVSVAHSRVAYPKV